MPHKFTVHLTSPDASYHTVKDGLATEQKSPYYDLDYLRTNVLSRSLSKLKQRLDTEVPMNVDEREAYIHAFTHDLETWKDRGYGGLGVAMEGASDDKQFVQACANVKGWTHNQIEKVVALVCLDLMQDKEDDKIKQTLNESLEQYTRACKAQATTDASRNVMIYIDGDKVLPISHNPSPYQAPGLTGEQREFLEILWDQGKFGGGFINPIQNEFKLKNIEAPVGNARISRIIRDVDKTYAVCTFKMLGLESENMEAQAADYGSVAVIVDITNLKGEHFIPGCASNEPPMRLIFEYDAEKPQIPEQMQQEVSQEDELILTRARTHSLDGKNTLLVGKTIEITKILAKLSMQGVDELANKLSDNAPVFHLYDKETGAVSAIDSSRILDLLSTESKDDTPQALKNFCQAVSKSSNEQLKSQIKNRTITLDRENDEPKKSGTSPLHEEKTSRVMKIFSAIKLKLKSLNKQEPVSQLDEKKVKRPSDMVGIIATLSDEEKAQCYNAFNNGNTCILSPADRTKLQLLEVDSIAQKVVQSANPDAIINLTQIALISSNQTLLTAVIDGVTGLATDGAFNDTGLSSLFSQMGMAIHADMPHETKFHYVTQMLSAIPADDENEELRLSFTRGVLNISNDELAQTYKKLLDDALSATSSSDDQAPGSTKSPGYTTPPSPEKSTSPDVDVAIMQLAKEIVVSPNSSRSTPTTPPKSPVTRNMTKG